MREAERREKLLTTHEVIVAIYGRRDLATPKSVYTWATTGVRVRAGMGLKATRTVRLEGGVQTPRGVMWPESSVRAFVDQLQAEREARKGAGGRGVLGGRAAGAVDPGAAVAAEIERNIARARSGGVGGGKGVHPTSGAERPRRRRAGNPSRAL
jgi:hypothetical protein